MSVSEWKKVNLYNLTVCPNYKSSPQSQITAVCYNAKQKIFCDSAGYVHVYFRNWDSISFRATTSAINLCQVTTDGTNLLVTLAQGEVADTWHLMVFSLNKINKRDGAPCVGAANISSNSTAKSLAVQMLDSQLYICIGGQNGNIWLHRAPLARDMSSNFQCSIITSWPITGMAFRQVKPSLHLFLCSEGGIFLYRLSDANSLAESKVLLDGAVAPARCCALLTTTKHPYFVVGRDDALYCFTSDGRGPCYAIEGHKSHIAALQRNLVVVLSNGNDDGDTIIIVDTTNRIIMLNQQVARVKSIMTDGDECHILTNDGQVFYMRELALDNKLRILCEKHLFNIALRFVETSNEEEKNVAAIANIKLKYGDYFLLKGELNSAIEKYIETLGHVEPYCVIQQLMDSRYTKYLTKYLNALVSTEFAMPEHVELLNNCNERLHLPLKLHNMYPHIMFNGNEDDKAPNFTFSNGLNLNSFVQSLSKTTTDLQQLFGNSSEEQIYDFFLEHGTYLLEQHSHETMQVLKALCNEATGLIGQPERFLTFLIFDEIRCREFLEHVTAAGSRFNSKLLHNALFELRLRAWVKSPQTVSTIDLLDFLRDREELLNCDQALILCRIYCFWPGLKYLFNMKFQGSTLTKVNDSSNGESAYSQILLKTLDKGQTALHGDGIGQSSHLFANLLNDMLDDKNQSILQILHNLCNNRSIMVKNVKEFFSQGHFSKDSQHLQQQNQTVKDMISQKDELQSLLEQYLQQPIEFRSSICDMCKQQLKPPSMYFLCQHSFHKECLSAYAQSQSCVLCIGKKKPPALFAELTDLEGDVSNAKKTEGAAYIDILCRGIFNQARSAAKKNIAVESVKPSAQPIAVNTYHLPDGAKPWSGRYAINTSEKPKISTKRTKTTAAAATNPFEMNPFEVNVQVARKPLQEYDNNLNPFKD